MSYASRIFENLRAELQKVVVGQDYLIERLIVALLASGHILLEGVPGLAKTRLLMALTRTLHLHMNRVQFTPDLLPSDLVGTEVYRPQSGEFIIRKGPIFTNLLLADEINRAPAKVQSALLQAMQERQVTIGEHTFQLGDPFMVLATQNPIEQEGTYQLPEAQLDRFLMKLKVSYPTFDQEVAIVQLASQEELTTYKPQVVVAAEDLSSLRQQASSVYVDPRIDKYVVTLVQATRDPKQHKLEGLVDWGASPRASIALKICARNLAFVRGKEFVTPEEVQEIAPDVLRHRVLPSFEADARSISSDSIVQALIKSVPIP